MKCLPWMCLVLPLAIGLSSASAADLPPISERFAQGNVAEEPDFQRHIGPLLGRLGCNGRSCHGSFQGRGGFRLSLFGYDFKADHEALVKGDKPRVNLENVDDSLMLRKPLSDEIHEGGQRFEADKWEHHVLRRWVQAGAKYEKESVQKLVRLEVTPSEIVVSKRGESVQLKAIAVWPNGTREDVTPLCRFQTNSEFLAKVTEHGKVTALEPGDTHAVVFYDNAVVPIPVVLPVSQLAGKKYPKVPTPTKVDELVVNKLKKLGIVPSPTCTDAEFLRRVSLDLVGTLPSAADTEAFLANPSAGKRAEKIDELLNSPAYAAWWTTKLCDFTGNNDAQLVNVGANRGTQDWYDWIYKRVAENAPYDELCEGIVLAVSRRPGQDYLAYCEEMSKLYHQGGDAKFADRPSMPYYWNRRNLRTSEERAIGFAYTFLGIRIQCAQCHKHPFDQWSKEDFEQFKGFFAGVVVSQANRMSDKEAFDKLIKELGIDPKLKGNNLDKELAALVKKGKTIPFGEVYATSAVKPEPGKKAPPASPTRVPQAARLLGSEALDLTQYEDARQPLMEWLRSADNPYFARAFVNRVWSNYFNVGIVQPPDDLSLANPPSNKPLLDYLTQKFVENKYDMKWLHREICNSATYQASWRPNDSNAKDERNFSHAIPRRLPAEAAYDAITLATLDDATAATYLTKLDNRAIITPGASARANNASKGFALQVFGRSIRESNCDCDRSSDASLLQTVYLQNDTNVLASITGGKGTWIDQLSREWSGAGTSPEREKLTDEGVRREIIRVELRLKQAKENGADDQAKRLGDRLAELQAAAKGGKPEKVAGTILSDEEIAKVIRQGYLRTLTREPSADELARCREFFADAATPVEGARGLLWALINTKEFIVNH